ncbi:glycine cleavage system aminomethyltransferase GcvT [Prosthecochloris sp.]|uniref:glycine cleavage system aminomethyltransferase GcvT n=1 Tax=Prosthecochloris sp. TaxID=290513 RepID=UPI00260155C3|nr:glycine cleavage system aminomethyltransferase GcvT [Prosthecochloris sp.]
MKKTALYSWHEERGAKMIDFCGYLMPVQYSGIIAEHKCVRTAVGLFDVSHMGNFYVTGARSLEFLQFMTSNDAASLKNGQAQYTLMLYPDGGIVDDLIIYRIDHETWFLVVNASNMEKDFNWLREHVEKFEGVSVEDHTERLSLIAMQGPKSMHILERVFSSSVCEQLSPFQFLRTGFQGSELMIACTGYTGEKGVEISVPNDRAEDLWKVFMQEGSEFGIQPIGLGARDTLRLEMGYPLYGHEISRETNPVETRLKWVTKLDKDDFIGKEACMEVDRQPERTIVGFVMEERAIPRQGYVLYDSAGNEIGNVCSGTMSPTLKKPIGTAHVLRSSMAPGSIVFMDVRNKRYSGRVVKLPFVNRG